LKELTPSKPVTIGKPLPTYSIVILDPDADRVVAPGELGEIGIAGIGVAAGYLNRDDLSRKKFIPDFLQIPNNLSQRIYRTGDLGRSTTMARWNARPHRQPGQDPWLPHRTRRNRVRC
jgi:non-ribosomal peptide synthetase component F